MHPEPYTCDLDPETGATLTVYLITDVENVEEVQANVTSGLWQCAAVAAQLVVAPLQLVAAANRAALAARVDALCTRSPAAETLYNLSLSRNISHSLSTFGVAGGCGCGPVHLLLCFHGKVDTRSVHEHEPVLGAVRGTRRPITHLPELTDWPKVTKLYKLHDLKDNADPIDIILTRMATKHIVAH